MYIVQNLHLLWVQPCVISNSGHVGQYGFLYTVPVKCIVALYLEYFVRRYTELVKEKLGTDLLDTQVAYSIRFYCMGAVGMTQEWVLNDNITSAETVVQMMFHSMPQNMQTILF